MDRLPTRIGALALLVALVFAALFALGGCSPGSSAITPIEGDVPEGMPAMYEFYTDW
jgi:hypothetical protein